MKKRIVSLILLLSALVVFCSCGGENTLSVKEDIIHLKVDEIKTVKVEQKKEEALTWSSADNSVAIVSPEGTVTAMGSGITTVTARGEDSSVYVGIIVEGNGEYIDENGNLVQVFDGQSDITKIVVRSAYSSDEISVKKGDKYQLYARTTPSDSDDPIVWQVENKSVVRVSDKGMLEAVGAGVTNVFAIAPNGVKGTMKVIVK